MRRPKKDPALLAQYDLVEVNELADLRAIARSVEAKPPKDDPKQPDPGLPLGWSVLVLVAVHLSALVVWWVYSHQ